MITVCFTSEDLALFSAASHDRNPLHMSDVYARATPFGERVVFGVLGAFAAMGKLRPRTDRMLQTVELEFRNPLTVGVSYRLDINESITNRALVKLYDAGRLMLKATFTFLSGHGDARAGWIQEAPGLVAAVDPKKESFKVGDCEKGRYGPVAPAFQRVVERWGLASMGATAMQITAMMWASFVVGMVLPGKRALFWRLALDFQPEDEAYEEPLSYAVTIQAFDERVDLLETRGTLSSGDRICATARMGAFVRPDSPVPSRRQLTELLPESELLRGKVALVIGGSRGLGGAISQALASQGCSVLVNYHQCTEEAEQIRASLGTSADLIELVQGDATNVEWCRALHQHLLERYGGLDMLICNASPPIRPLPFVPEKYTQFEVFLAQSVALVGLPMTSFLSTLSERCGWNIVVSSAFLKTHPLEYPHYVAAKSAVEGLVHWAAAQYPTVQQVIVRPPKLLTDQTNTTVGRQGTMRVEQVAASFVRQWLQLGRSPNVQILETF